MSAAQAPTEDRARRAAELAARRNRQAACALDYLVYGDDPAPHAERCICTPTCSRDYHLMPYPEAEPFDERLYTGSAIAALYGHAPLHPDWVYELAGWNIIPKLGGDTDEE